MKKLRLILGDQLNKNHSWFDEVDKDVIYFMAETKQETGYTKHHIQKIVGFFKAMRQFKNELEDKGHQFIYYQISSKENKHNLQENIKSLIKQNKIDKFEYQHPDEYRVDMYLKELCNDISIAKEAFDTEHFYTKREDLIEFYKSKKEKVMEYFYRDMRKKHDILMDANQPEGGQWNFDKSNRKKWTKKKEAVPSYLNFEHDVSDILQEIDDQKINYFGNIDAEKFPWPTSRRESLRVLRFFCDELLVHFGDYEDAMHTEEKMLFHSRLSFALNTKMISPKETIERVIKHYHEHKNDINISQAEGFVRQVLGWREYMRGMYWNQMPGYKSKNKLQNTNKLPDLFWTGKTKMNCLKQAVNQSLDHAYAHHIQRLMILGNFALLNMVDPDEVDAWYLGVYIDAIEWVEITNTRGMSQFADGGIIATKPYVSSGNYINKMSNYCQSCQYKVSKKEGDDACPFNHLYWNFLSEKEEHFKSNQRMNMMMNLLHKMDDKKLMNHKKQAKNIIKNPDVY